MAESLNVTGDFYFSLHLIRNYAITNKRFFLRLKDFSNGMVLLSKIIKPYVFSRVEMLGISFLKEFSYYLDYFEELSRVALGDKSLFDISVKDDSEQDRLLVYVNDVMASSTKIITFIDELRSVSIRAMAESDEEWLDSLPFTTDNWLEKCPEAMASVKRGLAQSAQGCGEYLGSFAEYAELDVED